LRTLDTKLEGCGDGRQFIRDVPNARQISSTCGTGDRLNRQQNLPLAGLDVESRRLPEAEVSKGLRIYVVTLIVLTAIAWCVVGIRGHILHEPYPRNTLFCCTGDEFSDFTDLSDRVGHFGEPNMLSRTDFIVPYPYPAPSIYIFLFFVRLFPKPLLAYLIFAVLTFFIAACYLSLRVHRITPGKLPQVAVWATLLIGFPLAFLLNRANIEAVIWVLVLFGIVAYTRNRMLTSAILWSIAASMKIFPGLLFVLFLAKRRYGVFATAVAATVLLSVLALAGVGPTIRQAALDSSQNAPFLTENYILTRNLPQFDHSLFAAIKQAIYLHAHGFRTNNLPPQTRPAFQTALRLYNLFILPGAGLLYWFRLRRMPLLNQFMACLILCVLVPQVSYEYKLVYLYLVWGAFLLFLLSDVATGRIKIPSTAIHVILFSCAVIFAPLSYLVVGDTFGFGGQIKTLFLALILLTALRVPMPSSLFGDLQSFPAVRGDSRVKALN
jgi:Glycosyltransferase family 87